MGAAEVSFWPRSVRPQVSRYFDMPSVAASSHKPTRSSWKDGEHDTQRQLSSVNASGNLKLAALLYLFFFFLLKHTTAGGAKGGRDAPLLETRATLTAAGMCA